MGIFGRKKEEARPDFSNVRAGGSSTAPAAQPQADGDGTSGESGATYVVVAGDSLSRIAKRYYGDAKKWPRIHEANRHIISNPDLIHPGQRLVIPL